MDDDFFGLSGESVDWGDDTSIIKEEQVEHVELADVPIVTVRKRRNPCAKLIAEEIKRDKHKRMLNPSPTDANLLDQRNVDELKREIICDANDVFTAPTLFTITVEGFIDNAVFEERKLISVLEPDSEVLEYRSNFGTKIYSGLVPAVPRIKSNRGRKKREKVKKPRKHQGTGDCFNSQISFHFRAPSEPINADGTTRPGPHMYKFKVFLNGEIQVPGAQQQTIDEVVECVHRITHILTKHLHAGTDVVARPTSFCPVMKDYKMRVKLPPGHVINLEYMYKLFVGREEKHKSVGTVKVATTFPPGAPPCHPIMFVKVGAPGCFAIVFQPTDAGKLAGLRLSIFRSGKINILGAKYIHIVSGICDTLYWLFKQYPKCRSPCGDKYIRWADNIEAPTVEQQRAIINEQRAAKTTAEIKLALGFEF